jgi:hypothetical protein
VAARDNEQSEPQFLIDLELEAPRDRDDDDELFRLLKLDSGAEAQAQATFALRDVWPEMTAAAEQKTRMMIQRVLGIELHELRLAARTALVESGYVDGDEGVAQ